jgi:hypothetical protein
MGFALLVASLSRRLKDIEMLTPNELKCVKNGLKHARPELAEAIRTMREGGEGMRSERLKTVLHERENAIALLEIETGELENVEVSNPGG